MLPEGYYIARLSEDDRSSLAIFDCYNDKEFTHLMRRKEKTIKRHSIDMNNFLINESIDEQDEGYNTTFLLKNHSGEIMAYSSLCTDAIKLSFNERDRGRIGYETFPSLKIARLAVDKKYQCIGCAKEMIKFAVSKALLLRQEACGIKFLTLDCYAHRLSYYTSDSIGFVRNEIQTTNKDKDKPISLRLDIDKYLEKLFP